MIKIIYKIITLLCILNAQTFSIARLHYGGGGDWYSNPSSLPNLLKYLESNTAISVIPTEVRIKLTDENANQFPFIYMTGHGNIRFTDEEIISLRTILMNNGFLHADDNYGMDISFRREMKRVFPNKEFVEFDMSLSCRRLRKNEPYIRTRALSSFPIKGSFEINTVEFWY